MTLPAHKTGYKGQKYQIRAKDGNDQEFGLGWTNDVTGGCFINVVKLHPVWHDMRVVEAGPDGEPKETSDGEVPKETSSH